MYVRFWNGPLVVVLDVVLFRINIKIVENSVTLALYNFLFHSKSSNVILPR